MSRLNKVNPDHYTMAGRLTPDDLARERKRQGDQQLEAGRRSRKKPVPPWMANAERASSPAAPAAEVEGAGTPRRQSAQKRGAAASRKGSRPAPGRKATGEAPGLIAHQSTQAAGASGSPRARKAPSARGRAARSVSPQRARTPAARKGRTKGSGTTRKSQKKK